MSASTRPRAGPGPNVPAMPGPLEMSAVALAPDGGLHSLDRAGRQWRERDADTALAADVIRRWHARGHEIAAYGAGLFVMPHGLTIDSMGHFWVTDVGLHQVFKLDASGTVRLAVGTPRKMGKSGAAFALPTAVAIAGDGSFFVADGYGNARVARFSATGEFELEWGGHGDADGQFRLPHAIDLDEDGQVYVADRENKRLQIFEPDGTHVQTISHPGIGKPFGLCVTPEAIYVADCGFPEDQRAGIAIVDRRTQAVRRIASYGAGDGQLLAPHDLVVGAGGDIFVADAVLGLRRFDAPSGVL